MANDDNIIQKLTEKGLIDERRIYCIGSVNKMDAATLLGGAIGGIASALESMVYVCVNGGELIISRMNMDTRISTCTVAELEVEKLKTGIMGGGKFVYRYHGKKTSLDCSNDFIKAIAPLVGVKL